MTLLSGNYDSLFRGRGLEIDTLREYVPGDNVKDIDWKATARTNITHTRVYAALRDQRIVIVADTSRSMLLPGHTSLNKLDTLYAVSVMLGNFVKRSHDVIALCAASGGRVVVSRFSSGSHHLESMLQTMDKSIHAPTNKETALTAVYNQLLASSKKRAAVFIVSDGMPQLATVKADLVKLCKRHQVFYVQLAPSWPFNAMADDGYSFKDIESSGSVTADIVASTTLQREWQVAFATWNSQIENICKGQGAAYGLITKAEDTPEMIRKMFLQAKRYAQHRR